MFARRPVDLRGWAAEIEQSTDLLTWVAASATTVTPNPGGTTERVSVLLPADGGKHFVRLKVNTP